MADLEPRSGMAGEPLSFPEFVSFVGTELGIEMPSADSDIVIGVDLELDSIMMLEMVVTIEELGVELPADIFLTAGSMRGVYHEYLRALGSAAGTGPA
jgi:acyl carrier protein